mmetsp:Transcript_40423/g.104800  ORF Transcript_40423/g.104800 Transcript_40423/m.104800 type:complete len:494 (-) Transcript_40423:6431-7912(-)
MRRRQKKRAEQEKKEKVEEEARAEEILSFEVTATWLSPKGTTIVLGTNKGSVLRVLIENLNTSKNKKQGDGSDDEGAHHSKGDEAEVQSGELLADLSCSVDELLFARAQTKEELERALLSFPLRDYLRDQSTAKDSEEATTDVAGIGEGGKEEGAKNKPASSGLPLPTLAENESLTPPTTSIPASRESIGTAGTSLPSREGTSRESARTGTAEKGGGTEGRGESTRQGSATTSTRDGSEGGGKEGEEKSTKKESGSEKVVGSVPAPPSDQGVLSVAVTASTSGSLWVAALLHDRTIRCCPLHDQGYAMLKPVLAFARDISDLALWKEKPAEKGKKAPMPLRDISAVCGFSNRPILCVAEEAGMLNFVHPEWGSILHRAIEYDAPTVEQIDTLELPYSSLVITTSAERACFWDAQDVWKWCLDHSRPPVSDPMAFIKEMKKRKEEEAARKREELAKAKAEVDPLAHEGEGEGEGEGRGVSQGGISASDGSESTF